MFVRVGPFTANVDVAFGIKLNLQLQPGLWVVQDDDQDYAVTSLQGVIDNRGTVHFAYPKGVQRKPSGMWGAKERLLSKALPTSHPRAAWAAVPEAVKELIEESYLLARHDTPESIGPQ